MAKSRARKLADIIVGAGIDIDGNLTFDGGSTSADLTFADVAGRSTYVRSVVLVRT